MLKQQVAEQFFVQHGLKYGFDIRTPEEVVTQGKIVGKVFERNLATFKIELTPKRRVKYRAAELIRVEFDDGWYAKITDNRVESQQTIIAIHGAPGNEKEWAGLETEMKGKFRWINFIIPGFDGQDERRGSYDGQRASLFALIFKLIDKLQLKRVTLCCHSFGSSIGFDLIYHYPSRFQGYVNVAGFTQHWLYGMTFLFKLIIIENRYYDEEWKKTKEYDRDESREVMYQKYVKSYYELKYNEYIPFFKKSEFFAFYKLTFTHPRDFEEIYDRIRKASILRVNLYGKSDHFNIPTKMQSAIYNLLYGEASYLQTPYYQKLFAFVKEPIEVSLREKFGVEVRGDQIQEYFNFYFEDTGHSIHKRRPEELSKIIQIYLTCLQVIHSHKDMISSSL